MTETLEPRRPLLLRLIHKVAYGRPYFQIVNTDGSKYLCRILLRGYLPQVHGLYGIPNPTALQIAMAMAKVTKDPLRIFGMRIPVNFYLHRFFREDMDRDLHNHPWIWSWAFPIFGGYIEEKRNRRTGKTRVRRVWPGMLNVLGQMDFHKVLKILGLETWSFFAAGGKGAAWGFIPEGRFVVARDYLRDKGYIDEGPSASTLPDWLLTCVCCAGRFPPPGNYYVRAPGRRGVRAHVCETCARLPYLERKAEADHVGI